MTNPLASRRLPWNWTALWTVIAVGIILWSAWSQRQAELATTSNDVKARSPNRAASVDTTKPDHSPQATDEEADGTSNELPPDGVSYRANSERMKPLAAGRGGHGDRPIDKTAAHRDQSADDGDMGKAVVDRPEREDQDAAEPNGRKPVDSLIVKNVSIRDLSGKVVYKGDIDLSKTLARIQSGNRLRFRNDGSSFQNREGRLPRKSDRYYTEWVHPTDEVDGPGPQRVVTGSGGEIYYTYDHYKTFKKLK